MADALEAEITEQIASKADMERLEERLGNQIAKLATENKADVQRLETQIGHLDEKLSGRIDNLKTTIGASVAIATLVLTAVQVYFGVR